jgi:tRNA nucleotidyltransferase/poly(A) polymerase
MKNARFRFKQQSSMPENVQAVMKRLRESGGEAYLVGGCVRDSILMQVPHDYDVATNLKLERVCEIFPKALVVGKSFGIVKVDDVDVSTFRIDGKYSDGRHPDSVMFVEDIVQDLSRRDFTINAIAFDGNRYVDPFNGMDALRRGVIQTVNAPRIRFDEDPLRMMRAFRFSSLLGYNIANSTYRAIRECKEGVRIISRERIREELLRMLCGENILGALFSMSASGLLFEILPDLRQCKGYLQNKYHRYDVLEHSFRVAAAVPSGKPLLRLAALLHDVGKPVSCKDYGTPNASFHNHEFMGADMCETVLQDMKFSRDERLYVTTLIRCHMFAYREEMKDSAIRRFLRHLSMELVPDHMLLKYADRVGSGKKDVSEFTWDTRLKGRIELIEKDKHALKVTDLAVNGKDLLEMGVESGPFMGKMLKMCLDYVLEHHNKNNPDALRNFVTAQLKQYSGDEIGVVTEEVVANV